MQLFLTELFAKVKTVRSTIYNHKTDIYDEESNQFDGLAKYKPFKKRKLTRKTFSLRENVLKVVIAMSLSPNESSYWNATCPSYN